jgi:sec-independent protein translocase protein TatA
VFGFHWFEVGALVLIALLIFGPKRVPEVGRMLGKGMHGFRKGVNDLERETGIRDVRDLAGKEIASIKELGTGAVKDVREGVQPKPAPGDK